VAALVESWNSIYSNHPLLRTAIAFLHVGGLTAGGGCAIAADLALVTISPARAFADPLPTLLRYTHRLVLFGLVAITLSGVLLFAADVDTYLYSRVFWSKMVLFLLLLANGVRVRRGERLLERGHSADWSRLRSSALVSLTLWMLTTLAGVALLNLG